jgi:formaldehyde-activating enzyme involved in methanogenesis
MNKSCLWRVSIQPVEKGVVVAENPIHTSWCEKDKIFEYVTSNPIFAGYKEMKSAPQRKRKSKKK